MGFIPSVAGLVVLIVGEDTVHVVLHDPDCMLVVSTCELIWGRSNVSDGFKGCERVGKRKL